jgi:hypothetical protein
MYRAKNFHPEWGYVAGANGFKRTIQIIFVAMAVGATAGGGVVLSLVDFPTGQASVAAHTSAAQAAISAPAQQNPKAIVKSEMPLQVSGDQEAAAGELSANPKNPEPPGPLAVVGPNDAPVNVATSPPVEVAPVESKATKKNHVAMRYPPRDGLFGFVQGGRYMNGDFGRPYRDGRWGGFYQNGINRYYARWR